MGALKSVRNFSLSDFLSESLKTLRRFPFVLAAAALFTALGVYYVTYPSNPGVDEWLLMRGILVTLLGIPLLLATSLFGERFLDARPRQFILNLLGVLALVLYFWTLPEHTYGGLFIHYLMVSAGVHVMVSLAPFALVREMNGFWQYNKTLLVRMFLAIFYLLVLYVGLSVCLGTIEYLFPLDVEPETYYRLWVVLLGMFTTWFFLAGIPEHWAELDTRDDYPRALRYFTLYVLVPLIVIYCSILAVYILKLLIFQQLPVTMVGYLVSGYAAFGVLSVLLVHPFLTGQEHTWMRRYERFFFYALVPLIVLLWVAMYRRIGNYGVTINRYLVVGLSLWLAGITVYYLLRGPGNIKVIPATLGVLILLFCFGPWGAFATAQRSQIGRLIPYLEQNGLIEDGTFRPASDSIPGEDQEEIRSIVRYLVGTHGHRSVLSYYPSESRYELRTAARNETRSARRRAVEFFNLPNTSRKRLSINMKPDHVLPMNNYSWWLKLDVDCSEGTVAKPIDLPDGREVHLQLDWPKDASRIRLKSDRWGTLSFDLRPIEKLALDKYDMISGYHTGNEPPENMMLKAQNERVRVRLLIDSVTMSISPDDVDYRNASFQLHIQER